MANEEAVLIEARRLSFRPARARAMTISEASFKLYAGITALVGPNGAGKTTLLRLLAALYRPAHGQIDWPQPRLRPAYVPQFPSAYFGLSPRQFLLRQTLWDGLSPTEAQAQVAQVLAETGLSPVADTKGRHLGESQRRHLALAQVMVQQASVVLLDEPTAALDPDQRLNFWKDLYTWAEGPSGPDACLMTTHHLAEVDGYCHRILLLDRGRIRFDGTVSELKDRAQGHTFWSHHPISDRPDASLLEMSWQALDQYAVLSERPHPPTSWQERPPSLFDGYMLALRGRRR